MNSEALRLGFIGFGEAASRFAKDLSEAGLTGIVANSRTGARATRMTQATRGTLQEIVDLGLRERFNAREPDEIAAVLDAIVELKRAAPIDTSPTKP